jgi:hypothetical protein
VTKDKGKDAWNRVDYEIAKRSTHAGLAAAASDGDVESAMKMIKLARGAVGGSQDIPETIREYLYGCLLAIEQGQPTDHAFNLKQSKVGAKPSFWKYVRDRDIAMAVQHLREQGIKRELAIAEVANTYTAFPQAGPRVQSDSVAKVYARFFPSKKGKK